MTVTIQSVAPGFHLYKEVTDQDATAFQKALVKNNGKTDHGLRFAKFFGRWKNGAPELLKDLETIERRQGRPPNTNLNAATDPLLDWLDPRSNGEPYRIPGHPLETLEAGNAVQLKAGNARQLKDAADRLKRLTTNRGACFDLNLISRLLIGIGLPHPIENGFLFHPTLAVPYIPGTALKQIARDWAEEAGVSPKELNRLFGAEDHGAGRLAFLDALPCQPVTLTAEQITNHYTGYYQNVIPGEQITDEMHLPADWYEPIPVTLLALDAGFRNRVRFRFAILPLRSATPEEVDEAQKWLTRGLEENGAGARTTLGFGRFEGADGKARREAKLPPRTESRVQAHNPFQVGSDVYCWGEEARIIAITGNQVTVEFTDGQTDETTLTELIPRP